MKRTGNNRIAVVGWGRGMGHTGHMYLADAVITQAKEMGADPYFFVSKTIGKDDPIYPEEKIKIYQKVFPQYAKIFTPEGNLNQALTDLSQLGYDGVVVVVGADQKNAFKYLENPNKEGVPVYQTMGFKKLRVISRQETRSKYASEEGPRATPMREVLMKPDATEETKFAVWRRDMPQALSGEEVLDLMHKAEQRMKAIPTKAKKLKEFITRVRPMLKEANAAQKLKVLKFIKESLVNEFAPGNGDDGLPYAEYVVYQCDPNDQFEFIGGPLYQTDNLGMAHKYAYEHYLRYRPKAFVVYQPHKEASRGNYGVKGESDEDVAEGFGDVVKGIKRKVAGKADPKEVEHMYGRIARSAIKHKTPDQAEKDIERYKKVSKVVNKEGVAEGAPIVVMPRADRLKKPEPTKVRYQGDIVPPTQQPSTEKRGVKGRPGQRPMPDQDMTEGDMTRRDFLTKSGVVGGALALGVAADLLTRGPSININGVEYKPASESRSERGAEVRTVKLKNGDIVKIWSLDRKGGHTGEKVIHLYRKVEQEKLDEGLGDYITKKIDDFLDIPKISPQEVSRLMKQAPANLPDDVAEKIVAKFMETEKAKRLAQQAAEANKTTVEKIVPYLTYFGRMFVDRWNRIPQRDRDNALRNLVHNLGKFLMFILEALVKGLMKKESVEEAKSKAIAQTAKDLKNPPKVMQHRAKRDMEREVQLRGRDIAKRDDDDFFPVDNETQQLMSYVRQHYPNATTKQQAFIKFVQRSLQHSKEEDETQDKEIDNLKKEIGAIKQSLPNVAESTDYLDEK